jgi:hypothetical protein
MFGRETYDVEEPREKAELIGNVKRCPMMKLPETNGV